jgi:predicted tellurium resistance membrane protein TerC
MDSYHPYKNKFIKRKKDDAMKNISCMKILSLLLLLFIATSANAQDGNKPDTNFMYSSGRIYVVIAVMTTILAGLILYLVRLDRKITRLEKDS